MKNAYLLLKRFQPKPKEWRESFRDGIHEMDETKKNENTYLSLEEKPKEWRKKVFEMELTKWTKKKN